MNFSRHNIDPTEEKYGLTLVGIHRFIDFRQYPKNEWRIGPNRIERFAAIILTLVIRGFVQAATSEMEVGLVKAGVGGWKAGCLLRRS